jgi:hypothetical protein
MEGALFLHVGMKKTGTSYLQSILRASTEELRRQQVVLLPHHEPAGHRLARAVLGRDTAGEPIAALSRQLAARSGLRCLVTQEMLGRANEHQIARLAPALGEREVHVVVTARDIARTIPSAWQQYVRARRSHRFDDFLDSVLAETRDPTAQSFWLDHGLIDLLRRWSRLAPPSAVHVVVVPGDGSDPELLLERFCTATAIESAGLTRDAARPNTSLGFVQVELLRRLNEEGASYPPRVYGKVYKREFARGVLGEQPGRRPLMPDRSRPWCERYTEKLLSALADEGYDVVGDPADLHPADSAFTDEPQAVSDAELADAAIAALRTLLCERITRVARSRAQQGR